MTADSRPRIALALAGGNALGAYAAGASRRSTTVGICPTLFLALRLVRSMEGIIAGNVPEQRIAKLQEFWRQAGLGSAFGLAPAGGKSREMYKPGTNIYGLCRIPSSD